MFANQTFLLLPYVVRQMWERPYHSLSSRYAYFTLEISLYLILNFEQQVLEWARGGGKQQKEREEKMLRKQMAALSKEHKFWDTQVIATCFLLNHTCWLPIGNNLPTTSGIVQPVPHLTDTIAENGPIDGANVLENVRAVSAIMLCVSVEIL